MTGYNTVQFGVNEEVVGTVALQIGWRKQYWLQLQYFVILILCPLSTVCLLLTGMKGGQRDIPQSGTRGSRERGTPADGAGEAFQQQG